MIAKLKDILEIRNGYQIAGRVQPEPDGPYAIIQIKDFKKDPADFTNLERITPERTPELYQVIAGDVLFLSRGQKLTATAIQINLKNTIASGYFFILRLKTKGILPEYLAWYLNSDKFQNDLSSYIKGSHIPLILKSDFQELTVSVPSTDIQRKVIELAKLADQDSRLNNLIQDKRKKLINAISLNAINSKLE
ncbi:MAG: hypothetical protein A2Y12_03970 [Planctomycetes bacterium GWF2_42_9]|nr:MAG: hypothetical protein A2Y12_03970 [Planctomycetes bacterium GWF2_42_9]